MLLLKKSKFPSGNSTKSVSETVCPLKIGSGFDHVVPWSREKKSIISMSLTVSRRSEARAQAMRIPRKFFTDEWRHLLPRLPVIGGLIINLVWLRRRIAGINRPD